MFKANNRNTRKRCEISSKLTIKTSERRSHSGAFIVNFEHISGFSSVSIVKSKQMLAGLEETVVDLVEIEAYSEPCWTSKMGLFAKIVNG